MAKMNSYLKEQFRVARAEMAAYNARVFFSRSIGMMLAIVPSPSDRKHGQIIFDITVALCHPNDKFKKKLGLIELYNNFSTSRNTRVRIEDEQFEDFAERMFDFEPFEEMEMN